MKECGEDEHFLVVRSILNRLSTPSSLHQIEALPRNSPQDENNIPPRAGALVRFWNVGGRRSREARCDRHGADRKTTVQWLCSKHLHVVMMNALYFMQRLSRGRWRHSPRPAHAHLPNVNRSHHVGGAPGRESGLHSFFKTGLMVGSFLAFPI